MMKASAEGGVNIHYLEHKLADQRWVRSQAVKVTEFLLESQHPMLLW